MSLIEICEGVSVNFGEVQAFWDSGGGDTDFLFVGGGRLTVSHPYKGVVDKFIAALNVPEMETK